MNAFLQQYFWPLLTGCLILFAITNLIMQRLSKGFFTMGKVRQSFSIFDLEFPSKSSELMKLIHGIDDLPDPAERRSSKAALRGHLLVDFLFMAAVYPFVFLLCWKAASKMVSFGCIVFTWLMWAQALAWIFDIMENIYLLRKMANPERSPRTVHHLYLGIVIGKWSLALIGVVCALFGLLFFWLRGLYSEESRAWVLGIVFSLVALVIASALYKKLFAPKPKPDAASGVGESGDAVTLGLEP